MTAQTTPEHIISLGMSFKLIFINYIIFTAIKFPIMIVMICVIIIQNIYKLDSESFMVPDFRKMRTFGWDFLYHENPFNKSLLDFPSAFSCWSRGKQNFPWVFGFCPILPSLKARYVFEEISSCMHASKPKFCPKSSFVTLKKMTRRKFENSKILQIFGIIFESRHSVENFLVIKFIVSRWKFSKSIKLYICVW